ncbi:hypothetical protein NQZ79_g4312 [Umbelopsis isabellina]|nr:hypothetical protein NQZ79_g4312 [Umbelopsis isabellina]
MSEGEDLFKLFSPTYHFSDPKLHTDSEWYIIAEQSILVEEEIFWNVISKWTQEPELVIPPLKKCEIIEQIRSEESGSEYTVRELISKRKSKDPPLKERVEYYPSTAYSLVYDSSLNDTEHTAEATIRLEIKPLDPGQPQISDDKMIYAMTEVFHKLYKWCIHTNQGYEKRAKHDILVPKELYHDTYSRIKTKYAESIISQWTEKTDVTKFVFEDIAIASYLISLWQLEREHTGTQSLNLHNVVHRLQTFVDLGCGNGLLTYLLVSEGHQGTGIDLAKRKIWDVLCHGRESFLIAQSLHPPSEEYPNVDWLIGNHADELVPWFLVIPCCYFQLDGSRHKGLSGLGGGKYREYTEYVKGIAISCGYTITEDHLRIPSTRNIAIVGQHRNVQAAIEPIIKHVGPFVARVSDRELEQQRRRKVAEKGK